MKYRLHVVNLHVLGVICAAVLLQRVNCLDPPRFQVSAIPESVYRYGTSNAVVLSMAPMNCIATVSDLEFYQSRWFAEMPDGNENQLDPSDARITIIEGPSIRPDHQGTVITISSLSYLDNGTYRCEIQENNMFGQPISEWGSTTVQLVLEVRLKSVDINSTVRTFNDSQFVELGCDMSGYIRPDKDLLWIVNGAPATTDGSKYRVSYCDGDNVAQFGGTNTISSRVAVLTILDVNLADSGVYSCAINNTNLMNDVNLEVTPASRPSGYPQGVQVTASSSTSLNVSWNKVSETDRNGNITHYEILYTPVNSPLLDQLPKISTTGGPVLVFILEGLEEYTIYSVSVRAVTVVGSGPLSPPQMNQTLEDVPSAPPRNLVITSLDKNSLQVSWEQPGPNDINGVLRLYEVEYCTPIRGVGNIVMNNCTKFNITGTENGVLLTSLKEGTTYTVSVAAYTVGLGPPAMGSATTRDTQLPLEPEDNGDNGATIAGIVIGVLLASIAVVLIASVIIGFIIRNKYSRRQHKQIPSTAVESQAASVVETVRAPSPNLLPVAVSTETGTLDYEIVGEEITEPITSNGSLKKPTNVTEEEVEDEHLDVSVQPKLELTELLKDEPPQYKLFDPTPPSETAEPVKESAQEEESEAVVVKLNFDDDDGAVDSAQKDDIDSPLSMDGEQGTDTKQELMELLQSDGQDSS